MPKPIWEKVNQHKPIVHIDSWEVHGKYLWGIPKDHPSPRVSNTHMVKTSSIVRIETENTVYILGEHLKDGTKPLST